ncbi:MAG TPA: LysM peptidoglycan-binding domain-containing protein [Bacilli bacterium]
MADRQTGFRFDIYERIVLPEDAAGIGELEEIELTPDIQAQSAAGKNVLKGYLHLTGRYLSDDAGESKRLEYDIPVEITVPATRSLDMRDVQADIENFDVDILSKRSLHITGVLALNGLKLPAEEDGQEAEEELFFIHHSTQPEQDDRAPQHDDLVMPSGGEDEPLAAPKEDALPDDHDAYLQIAENPGQMEPLPKENVPEQDEVPVVVGKKAGPPRTEFGKLADTAPRETNAAPGEKAASPDALEWKKLFLQQDQEDQFRKFRMCIVQKEESVASIAERYNISAREIMQVNKLPDEDLSEGQVLYIPG